METMIIVSVLTTLGVVSVLISIVVAFIKLRGKVGVEEIRKNNEETHRLLEYIERRIDDNVRYNDDKFDRLISQIYETISTNDTNYTNEFNNLNRLLDSRCDKLYEKIKLLDKIESTKTEKQILND
jgi:hypothetical protein